MAIYIDSSVAVSALLQESRSHEARRFISSDEEFLVSWLSVVEIRRNFARAVADPSERFIRERIMKRLSGMLVATVDEADWKLAAFIAEETLLKTLDSIHLAIAKNLGLKNLTFLTFDKKQASVARQMGFSVVGA